ncbi:MAG TPA: ion channel [Acidimicrobiales bacterium]|nr:ion channel [Acidimicrobiales bacterium]
MLNTGVPPAGVREEAPGRPHPRVQDRFGLLLFLVVASFLEQGFGDALWVSVLGTALFVLALVVGFRASGVGKRPAFLAVTIGLSLGAVALFGVSGGSGPLFGAACVVLVLLGSAVLASVLGRVLRHRTVTAQTLLGAASSYMLIGLTFAAVYGALDGLLAQPIFGHHVAGSVYGYFSFTTMTTVGYGDYTLKLDIARRIAMLQAVSGQLFLATLVARLVSLYRGGRRGAKDADV